MIFLNLTSIPNRGRVRGITADKVMEHLMPHEPRARHGVVVKKRIGKIDGMGRYPDGRMPTVHIRSGHSEPCDAVVVADEPGTHLNLGVQVAPFCGRFEGNRRASWREWLRTAEYHHEYQQPAGWVSHGFLRGLAHRARAACRAISLRRAGLSLALRA